MSEVEIITPELYDLNQAIFDEKGLKVGDTLPEEFKLKLSGEEVDFVVTQEFLDANPGLEYTVGETIKIPKEVATVVAVDETVSSEDAPAPEASAEVPAGQDRTEEEVDAAAIADGSKIKEEVENGAAPEAVVEEVPVESIPTYNGSDVVSDGMREVNGKEYHHLRLADGSECDLSDEDYQTYLNSNGK